MRERTNRDDFINHFVMLCIGNGQRLSIFGHNEFKIGNVQ